MSRISVQDKRSYLLGRLDELLWFEDKVGGHTLQKKMAFRISSVRKELNETAPENQISMFVPSKEATRKKELNE